MLYVIFVAIYADALRILMTRLGIGSQHLGLRPSGRMQAAYKLKSNTEAYDSFIIQAQTPEVMVHQDFRSRDLIIIGELMN